MKVLWISPGFAANEEDINNIPPLQDLAFSLKAKGVDITILTIHFPHHNAPYLWHGIPVRSAFWFRNRYLRIFHWLFCLRHAVRANKQQKFDVIHSFWLGPSWIIGRILSSIWKIPHLTTLMGQDVRRQNLYLKFLKQHHVASLVAVSNFQRLCFEKNTGQSLSHVIPWGIKEELIHFDPGAIRDTDILGVGSLTEVKNWTMWIRLVADLSKNHPNIRAKIIGSGKQHAELTAFIKSLGVDSKISILPEMPRTSLIREMANAKIFLHTARFESFGMVLLEAFANGCQIVSTDVGIAEELGQTGNDETLLSDKLNQALSESRSRPGFRINTIDECALAYKTRYNHMAEGKF